MNYIPERFQFAFYDFAINSGPDDAALCWQKTVNFFFPNSLKEDGDFGSKTVDITRKFLTALDNPIAFLIFQENRLGIYIDKTSNKAKLTDIFEDVVLDDSVLVDGKIPFKYGKVYGNFSLTKCKTLKSYEGCPEIVYGDFKAAIKSDIENFEGCPKFVGGNFDASGHVSLKNLKGSPEKVVKKYIISHCDNLKNLEGSSKDVGGFICSYCKELETLDGAPIVVRGDFVATFCKKLLSVMKLPKDISGKIDMTGCSRLSIRDLRNRFGYTLPDNFIHDLKESFEIKLKRMYLKEKYENNI